MIILHVLHLLRLYIHNLHTPRLSTPIRNLLLLLDQIARPTAPGHQEIVTAVTTEAVRGPDAGALAALKVARETAMSEAVVFEALGRC